MKRLFSWAVFVVALSILFAMFLFIRIGVATDHLHHALVKDPERTPPSGNVIVAPADGTVLYIRRIEGGVIPEVVKRGVSVPLVEHLRLPGESPPADGWLIGVYMNSDSVHINRVPLGGRLLAQHVWNGPHMDMSSAESTIMLTKLLPGWVGLKKMIGVPPFDIEDDADFVLKSARETLVFEDLRGKRTIVTRIADFYVGKILTWIPIGAEAPTGQRLGMITWGSQTDVFVEDSVGLEIEASVGDFVYGGETVLATY